MKILFIGCVESSYILLNELIKDNANICGVITKKAKKNNSDFVDLMPLCNHSNIECLYYDNLNEEEILKFMRRKCPSIIYCFGWPHLLSENIIRYPELGTVGFHPTKLPSNKGRHPLIWALVLGLESTASTFFMINENVDDGDIVSQVDVFIDIEDDARSLYDKVMDVAKRQVIQITKLFYEGNVTCTSQSIDEGNVWRKRTKKDGRIDFRMSSTNVYNLVRGLTRPYVGAHLEYQGNEYKVWSTEIVSKDNEQHRNIEPGKVMDVYTDNSFLVKTGDGLVKITEADKIELMVGDYL